MHSIIEGFKNNKYFSLLVLVIFIHSFFVIRYGVNIPYWDEWEVLNQDAIPSGFTFNWIFAPHNEHIIAVSKILIFILYKLNGLNITYLITLSWFIYLALIFTIFIISKSTFPSKLKKYLPLVFIFLLSPILHENHAMGFQICFHFSLLFQLIGICWAVKFGLNKLHFIFVGFFLILSCYSLSIGLPMTVSTVIGLIIYNCYKFKYNSSISKHIKLIFPLFVFLTIGLSYWVLRFKEIGNKTSILKTLSSPDYWKFIIIQIGLGFGFNEHPEYWWLGLIPLILFLISIIQLLISWVSDEQFNHNLFIWFIFGACIISAQATISIGRYTYGPKQALSSRYSEVALMWIPIITNLFFYFLDKKISLNKNIFTDLIYLNIQNLFKPFYNFKKYISSIKFYFALFVILIFCGFLDDWDFRHYQNMANHKFKGIECLKKSSLTQFKEDFCPDIYPYNLGTEKLITSKKLNFSFSNNY